MTTPTACRVCSMALPPWERLPLRGFMPDEEAALELRNCPACGNTTSRHVPLSRLGEIARQIPDSRLRMAALVTLDVVEAHKTDLDSINLVHRTALGECARRIEDRIQRSAAVTAVAIAEAQHAAWRRRNTAARAAAVAGASGDPSEGSQA